MAGFWRSPKMISQEQAVTSFGSAGAEAILHRMRQCCICLLWFEFNLVKNVYWILFFSHFKSDACLEDRNGCYIPCLASDQPWLVALSQASLRQSPNTDEQWFSNAGVEDPSRWEWTKTHSTIPVLRKPVGAGFSCSRAVCHFSVIVFTKLRFLARRTCIPSFILNGLQGTFLPAIKSSANII